MKPKSSWFMALSIAALLAGASVTASTAQTLTIGVRGGPDSIDPHFTATGTHAESLKHIFDTLTWSGDGLEVEPRLAESWKALDATTWEFKLRKGVKFHDGSDFTADDVKFSIERIPVVAGPNPTTIYVRRVKEAKVVDPHTIHIITDGPAPVLPNDFIRLFIVSSKAAAGLTKETANEAFNSGKAAIGTGPYKYVSWSPKGDLVMDRFDGYWGAEGAVGAARPQGDPERCRPRRAIEGRSAGSDHARAGDGCCVPEARSEAHGPDDRYRLRVQSRNGPARRDAGRADLGQGRLAAGQEPAPGRSCPRGDRSRDRPQDARRDSDGRARQAGQPARHAVDLRLQQGVAGTQVRRRGGEEAARRRRLRQWLQGAVLVHQGPPARRHPGRHLDRADACRHRHRCGGERAAGERVLPGAHARRILDVDVGLGNADRRGALHLVVARAFERQGKEDGCVQCAQLQERGDGQAAAGRGGRDG